VGNRSERKKVVTPARKGLGGEKTNCTAELRSEEKAAKKRHRRKMKEMNGAQWSTGRVREGGKVHQRDNTLVSSLKGGGGLPKERIIA